MDRRPQYHLIDNREKFQSFCKEINSASRYAFDTEGTSLNAYENTIIGISFAWDWWNGYYIPLYQRSLFGNELESFWSNQEEIVNELLNILTDKTKLKTAHNGKYDYKVLKVEYGIEVVLNADSIIYAKQVNDLDPVKLSVRHRMFKDIAGYDDELEEIKKELKRQNGDVDLSLVPLDKLVKYAAFDALASYRLTEVYAKKLKE